MAWVSMALLATAALVMLKWPKDEAQRGLRPTKSRSALSMRETALNQGEEEDRFENLDPRFHDLAQLLDEERTHWRSAFGPFHHFKIEKYEWNRFARRKIAELSVEEIEGLLSWIGEGELPFYEAILDYREAIWS